MDKEFVFLKLGHQTCFNFVILNFVQHSYPLTIAGLTLIATYRLRTHTNMRSSTVWCRRLREPCLIHTLYIFYFLFFFHSPPLPAVFAGSFSARRPEAAVAPVSLPTSVFVVGDDMSKL